MRARKPNVETKGHTVEEPNTITSIAGIKPFARIVIRNGQTYLLTWNHWLTCSNIKDAAYRQVAAAGTVMADVARDMSDGVRELFIVPVKEHPLCSEVRAQLVEFAKLNGYGRVWLDEGHGVVDLDGLLPLGAEAFVTCEICGTEQRDSSVEFWRFVARTGRMPHFCPCCGFGGLPQWTVAKDPESVETEASIFGRDWSEGPWLPEDEPAASGTKPNSAPADGMTLKELLAADLAPGEEVVLDPTEWDGSMELDETGDSDEDDR